MIGAAHLPHARTTDPDHLPTVVDAIRVTGRAGRTREGAEFLHVPVLPEDGAGAGVATDPDHLAHIVDVVRRAIGSPREGTEVRYLPVLP